MGELSPSAENAIEMYLQRRLRSILKLLAGAVAVVGLSGLTLFFTATDRWIGMKVNDIAEVHREHFEQKVDASLEAGDRKLANWQERLSTWEEEITKKRIEVGIGARQAEAFQKRTQEVRDLLAELEPELTSTRRILDGLKSELAIIQQHPTVKAGEIVRAFVEHFGANSDLPSYLNKLSEVRGKVDSTAKRVAELEGLLASEWFEARLVPPWEAYEPDVEGAYTRPGFRLLTPNTVLLRGLVRYPGEYQDITDEDTVIFVLPDGFRPPVTEIHHTVSKPGVVAARIDVRPNGEVLLRKGKRMWVSLDGMVVGLSVPAEGE